MLSLFLYQMKIYSSKTIGSPSLQLFFLGFMVTFFELTVICPQLSNQVRQTAVLSLYTGFPSYSHLTRIKATEIPKLIVFITFITGISYFSSRYR